jgi:hypothetical protein
MVSDMTDPALMGSNIFYENIPHCINNQELKDYIVAPQGIISINN